MKFELPISSHQKEFICGWGAGCFETCILFPSYKLIFRQQLYGLAVKDALKQLKVEGFHLLYRGLLPPLVMRTSSRALMFGMNEEYRRLLACPSHTTITGCHASAAFLAGLTEGILCPLERVQVLLQTAEYHDRYKNTGHVFKSVYSLYGFKELYRGWTPILFRNGASNALFFTLREPLHGLIIAQAPSSHVENRSHWNYSVWLFIADFVSGAVLGASLSTIFFPVNVVKNRMQSVVGTPFQSPFRVFRIVWKERNGSVKELFRGVHLNFTRSLIAWGITNSMFEFLRRTIVSRDK